MRPYPRALAGEPIAWDSHPRRAWTLEYAPQGDAPTELVVPKRWRGAGCRVHAHGADDARGSTRARRDPRELGSRSRARRSWSAIDVAKVSAGLLLVRATGPGVPARASRRPVLRAQGRRRVDDPEGPRRARRGSVRRRVPRVLRGDRPAVPRRARSIARRGDAEGRQDRARVGGARRLRCGRVQEQHVRARVAEGLRTDASPIPSSIDSAWFDTDEALRKLQAGAGGLHRARARVAGREAVIAARRGAPAGTGTTGSCLSLCIWQA